MQLNGVASAVIVIWFVLSSLALIALLAVVTLTLVKLQAKLEELTQRVDPLLTKTDALLTVADEKLRVVGERAETLLATSEEIAETVQERVERTTGTVQRTVNAPIIQANALTAGLTRAWKTFGNLSKNKSQSIVPVAERSTTDSEYKEEVRIYGG